MNRQLFLTLFAVVSLGMLSTSCQKSDMQNASDLSQTSHKVSFNVNFDEPKTKTALSIKVVPNWKNTDDSQVNLFETKGTSTVTGTDCEIHVLDAKGELAQFSATFPSHVENPSAQFHYTGVVATKNADGNYEIPAIQKPDEEGCIDPNADILIGDSKTDYQTTQSEEDIDLYFVRPVALSRLAITNVEGDKIIYSKIISANYLTGTTDNSNINFSEGTATFTDGSKELTMDYGVDGVDKDNTFYAYFISLAGSKTINQVEVATENWLYTKTIAKSSEFVVNEFKNIALDMTLKEGITERIPYLRFVKDDKVITSDTHDLSEGEEYVSPLLKCPAPEVIEGGYDIEYSSSEQTVATVDDNGAVTPLLAGETEITAIMMSTNGFELARKSYKLTISGEAPKTNTIFYPALTIENNCTYVIVDDKKALKATTSNDGNVSSSNELTFKNNTFELDLSDGNNSDLLWTAVNLSSGKFNLKSNTSTTYYLYRKNGSAVYQKNSLDASSDSYKFLYSNALIVKTDYYVYRNGSNWTTSDNSSKATTVLFTSKKPQTLTFNPTEAEYDVADPSTFTKPTLSGNMTDVTYSSDNNGVQVNSATGEIVSVGINCGTVTITATAASSTEYQSASASYTLTVRNSDFSYQLVSSGPAQGTADDGYLFVFKPETGNTAYVYKGKYSGGGTVRAHNDTKNDPDAFLDADNALAVTLEEDGSISSTKDIDLCALRIHIDNNGSDAGKVSMKMNCGYFVRLYKSTTTSHQFCAQYGDPENPDASGFRPKFTFSGNNLSISKTESSTPYYMTYNTTEGKFVYTSTSGTLLLYKLSSKE